MKKRNLLLIAFTALLIIAAALLYITQDNSLNNALMKGNIIVKQIEAFKRDHKQLPESLSDIDTADDFNDVQFSYDKEDSTNFHVSFRSDAPFTQSRCYHSDSRQWEDTCRPMP